MSMLKSAAAGLTAAFVLFPAVALAQAPEPRRTVDLDRFMGRWHESLRTPNNHQRDCWAANQVWAPRDGGGFTIRQTCHRGSRTGPARVVETRARVLDTQTNAKFEASFFGGLIRQRYWVIDRADDYSWMIATTADGAFPALLSRRPAMTAGEVAALTARMRELGLPTEQLTSSER